MPMYSYCTFMYIHRASWHSSATLTEGFPCFFFSCKANSKVKPAKTGHGPLSSKLLCCSMYYLFCVVLCIIFVCKCVLYYYHRLATQLQLTNILSSCSGRIRFDSCSLYPQNEIGSSISSSVVLCVFVLLVYIVVVV